LNRSRDVARQVEPGTNKSKAGPVLHDSFCPGLFSDTLSTEQEYI